MTHEQMEIKFWNLLIFGLLAHKIPWGSATWGFGEDLEHQVHS